ncbi:MAG TPA: DUF4150 domain-containing protein [Gammaproteobacteria bacterium]|nr:DUF4150 domain-containing protein [Gammaproteobacteria bacterium]
MFQNTQMPGMNFAIPDVCLTPPFAIPIPYPNIAMSAMAIPSQFKILNLGMPVHNMMTMGTISLGDQAGVMLNPLSGMFMGPYRHFRCSTKVFSGGLPTTRMLDNTGQDGLSPGAFGLTLVPGQFKSLVLS